MKLRTLLSNLSLTNPWLLTGAALLIIALGLLVVVGDQALAQEGGEEQREGYEKRLADRIARYQAANAGRGGAGLISNLVTSLETGGSDEFTVSASGLDTDLNYRYDFDIGSSGAGIAFDEDCITRYTGLSVPQGSESYSDNVRAYACATGRYTITASLYEYSVDEDETYLLDTDEQVVTVFTVENTEPEFDDAPYGFLVPEDAGAGTEVGSVSATDPDNDPLTYSITIGNTGNAFAIGSSSGRITVARALSGLTATSYSLRVRVDDGGGGQDTAPVNITVVNKPPVFDQNPYERDVPEDAPVGWVVRNVSATDPGNDPLTYSITGNAFAVGSSSGEITVARGLDHETTSRYSLTVSASDGYGGVGTATVNITVGDVNEPPVFSSGTFEFDVREDAPVGWVVRSVSADDPENDPLTYSITEGNTGNAFAVGSSSGEITVARGLDYDITPLYLLTVTARDGNGGVGTGYVDITVEEVNQAPTITGGSSFVTYPENSTYVVSTYTASDPDGHNVAWTLSGNDRARFSIDADSGQLSFRAPPDFEVPTDVGGNNLYNVTVVATDDASNPLSSYRDVTIRVSDVNEDPEVATQIPDQVLSAADSPLTFDLSDSFSDPDGDALRYVANSSAPGVVGRSVNGNILTLTPGLAGTARVTVTAHDRPLGVVGVLSASPVLRRRGGKGCSGPDGQANIGGWRRQPCGQVGPTPRRRGADHQVPNPVHPHHFPAPHALARCRIQQPRRHREDHRRDARQSIGQRERLLRAGPGLQRSRQRRLRGLVAVRHRYSDGSQVGQAGEPANHSAIAAESGADVGGRPGRRPIPGRC